MRLLLAFAAALPLAAQLEVQSLQGSTPVALGPSANLGTVAAGDSTDFRFQAMNTGAAPLAINSITVGGTGYSLPAAFAPVILAPGESYPFSVRFSPKGEGSYSASLAVNSFTSLLRATVVLGPSLYLTNGGQATELTAGSMQVNLVTGQALPLAFSIGNPHARAITITDLSISGPGFAMASSPALPLMLGPGERAAIPVTVTASAEGEALGTLLVGARRFDILATAIRPKLAPPAIVPSDSAPRNGQQLKLRLTLPQPALGAGTGMLRATFMGASEDPAIVFPNGTREIKFDVAAGGRDATFGGAAETVIQTGTTAGTLRLEAITETGVTTETFRFERGLIVVDEAVARRSGSTLEIDITGFDNTRAAGSLNFRFFDRSGAPIGGVISATPGELFKNHFDQSVMGGVFRLRASFPVTGDATMVGSVLVEIANPVGRTDLQRLLFP